MKLYAYCLSDEVTERALEGLAGVVGARTRLLDCEGIAIVVSEMEGDAAVAVTRENVLAHERVVGSVLKDVTPLPFRFGTVATEERLRGYVSSQADSLRAQLASVRGCVEMSVKIIWDVESVRRAATNERTDVAREGTDVAHEGTRAAVASSGEASGEGRGRGAAFLFEKRREILGDEHARARADEVAAWLAAKLEGAVRDSVVAVRPREALVVSAAHLVERARLADYKSRLASARAERRELSFLTSGAWSPYSFTNARA